MIINFTHNTNRFALCWFTYPAPVSSGSSRGPPPEVYRGRPRWRMSVWTPRSPGCRLSSELAIDSLSRNDTCSPFAPDTVGWVHSGGSHRPSSWPDQTSNKSMNARRDYLPSASEWFLGAQPRRLARPPACLPACPPALLASYFLPLFASVLRRGEESMPSSAKPKEIDPVKKKTCGPASGPAGFASVVAA